MVMESGLAHHPLPVASSLCTLALLGHTKCLQVARHLSLTFLSNLCNFQLKFATMSGIWQLMADATNQNCMRKATTAPSAITSSNSLLNAPDGIQEINTLFFDLDNTLIPTRVGDLKACRKLSEVLENQFAFTREESTAATQSFLKAFRRCPDNSQTSLDSWRTYLWREALPQRHKHLAEQIYRKWLQLRYRYLALPAEYVQMLKRFHEARFLLALITNGPSNAQWEKIKKLNVRQHFDCVLVSSDLPWEKPHPNIFYAACNFLGVKPAECAMVGDKLETDIKGGHLAHLGATFWLPLNFAEIGDLTDVTHPPDIILRNLLDICKYFPALHAASGSAATTSAAATTSTAGLGGVVGAPPTNLQSHRRGSQISCSATTSTCDNDLNQRHQQQQQQRSNFQHIHSYHQHNHHSQHKYRRGGSLPAVVNSETENSSDSLFD